eukprot:Nitzschia sp. Nitz4//scaffold39_size137210//67766//69739//NITZ4_003204-RA/size137210-processed-gene-0.91-mRNA-1//1//CDS//3329550398//5030//frame0
MKSGYSFGSLFLSYLLAFQRYFLQPVDSVAITDATANYVASTESTYDHMIELEDNLYFHWNDIMADSFSGRLIHNADSIDQAPTYLAFAVYHSNHNYTTLPTDEFMVGSVALVGLVTSSDASVAAQHFRLGGQTTDDIYSASEDTSFSNAFVVQHDSDSGTVTTDLSFTKSLSGSSGQGNLRREGTNVLLWAVGPAEGSGQVMAKHTAKGVMYLDFSAVQQQSSSTVTREDADTSDGTTSTSTAPIVTGQCGSDLLGGGDSGQILLTPAITFHYKLTSGGTKVQLALEYTGEDEAWLAIAASKDGNMVGSSGVIASPGDDSLGIDPTHYNITDQDLSGLISDASVILEDASITSALSTADPTLTITTLMFTKKVADPNDGVPINTGLTTFLYAVGESRELAYHEHRGAFQLDLEGCGGTISASGSVWTHHGTFATHGFLATLAWALATPFAVTVAWFRTLVPASWIYIHVFANVFSFFGTLLAVIIVVLGIKGVDGATHFSKTHHWVGLLLLCFVTFQFVNGFLRPPVQRKESNAADLPQEKFLGVIPIPQSPRETWQLMHRSSGLIAVALGVFQIQSGLGLYADRFQTTSMVSFYWMYIGIFITSLVGLKIWVIRVEEKARQGVMQAVSTTEPDGGDLSPDSGEPRNPGSLSGTMS